MPTRREVLAAVAAGALPLRVLTGAAAIQPVVSVVKIRDGKIGLAVEHALELLGGVRAITRGKERVFLKPNLVAADPNATTNPAVVRALARLMLSAGKDVTIGEGSAAAAPFNVRGGEVFRTTKRELLNGLQGRVFDALGYSELARSLRVPLVNLHTGDLRTVKLGGAFVFPELTLHRALVETDLLCSVPIMKTHSLAVVTLGLKNLIGAYPGTIYQSVRGRVHDRASEVESSGTAAAIVDMVRANRLGLTVIDASMAMEGDGPMNGTLVPMELIIAGTNPLATDMIAAHLMGFRPDEIPTFAWANRAGLEPRRLDEIEVRGDSVAGRNFARAHIQPWRAVRDYWGAREI